MAEEAALRATYVDNPSIGGRDDLGELVAVAAVAPGPGGTRTATALVHPSVRGQGVDAQVVRWCEERSAGHRVVVALDTVPPQAESVLSEAGFHRVFGETVMRHGLRHSPSSAGPRGSSSCRSPRTRPAPSTTRSSARSPNGPASSTSTASTGWPRTRPLSLIHI